MVWVDWVNGLLFELLGGLILWRNVAVLRRERLIRGVDWRVTAFFQAWGVWNLVFYSATGNWVSFFGGLCITAANTAWLWYAWEYRRN